MIDIKNIEKSEPYLKFYSLYNQASLKKQQNIEAAVISSYDNILEEVNVRCVNLKYIYKNNWIFFSNYKSPKAMDFEGHKQIACVIYWPIIKTQIRIKANIKKTSNKISDEHFLIRSKEKNAVSISSFQSSNVDSYDRVISSYKATLNSTPDNPTRPDYWGGYSFEPYYFEFWEGNESRLNKRDAFQINNSEWQHSILQP